MAKRNGPRSGSHPGNAPGQIRASGGTGRPGTPPASPTPIPDKLYFRIGEVASLCDVETYVLRFWQTEFAQLRPGKSGTGQRLYRRRDVEMAMRIKRLLHEEGYTIAGARSVLASEAAVPQKIRLQPELPLPSADPAAEQARTQFEQMRQSLRRELRDLLGMLDRKPSPLPNQAHKLQTVGRDAPTLLFTAPSAEEQPTAKPSAAEADRKPSPE
jgi:DNA-binding transcriptional MerR regulator